MLCVLYVCDYYQFGAYNTIIWMNIEINVDVIVSVIEWAQSDEAIKKFYDSFHISIVFPFFLSSSSSFDMDKEKLCWTPDSFKFI